MSEANGNPTLTKAAMGIKPGLPLTVSDGGIEELRAERLPKTGQVGKIALQLCS